MDHIRFEFASSLTLIVFLSDGAQRVAAVPGWPAGGGVCGRPPEGRGGRRADGPADGAPGRGEGAGGRPAQAERGRLAAGHPEGGAEGESAETGCSRTGSRSGSGEAQRGARQQPWSHGHRQQGQGEAAGQAGQAGQCGETEERRRREGRNRVQGRGQTLPEKCQQRGEQWGRGEARRNTTDSDHRKIKVRSTWRSSCRSSRRLSSRSFLRSSLRSWRFSSRSSRRFSWRSSRRSSWRLSWRSSSRYSWKFSRRFSWKAPKRFMSARHSHNTFL